MHPFTPSTRRPKFALSLEIHDLNNIPLVSGTCYVKWYLPHSVSAEHRGRTAACPIKDHLVTWNSKKDLSVRMTIDRQRSLETCEIRFEIVQEYYSGAKGERIDLGWVKLNLAEYISELGEAGTTNSPIQPSVSKDTATKPSLSLQTPAEGVKAKQPPGITRRYLMRDSKINSTLKLSLGMHQLSGDQNFIVPPLRTAPVFGGIAGFMAASGDPSSTSLHELNDEDEESRSRNGVTNSAGAPLKDRVENQDLYRSSLVASWGAMPDELLPEEVIEDIFNGGDGWRRDGESKDPKDQQFLDPRAARSGIGAARHIPSPVDRYRTLRKEQGDDRASQHRPWQKRTSTSPTASKSFFGLYRHQPVQDSNRNGSQDQYYQDDGRNGYSTATLRPESNDPRGSIPRDQVSVKSGKTVPDRERRFSNEGLVGSSSIASHPKGTVHGTSSSRQLDETEVREDLRSWTIAGYG